jgi:hypothetical protein
VMELQSSCGSGVHDTAAAVDQTCLGWWSSCGSGVDGTAAAVEQAGWSYRAPAGAECTTLLRQWTRLALG